MISIIVPVYNVAPYLPQCLDSLVNQTYRDIEIICVNDGSTDSSLEILQSYAEKDIRIRIISQQNQGLSGARNAGIEAAQGEWIMFVDSDDWTDTDCCEKVMETIDPSVDVCIFNYTREFTHTSSPKYIFDQKTRHFAGKDAEWLYVRLIAPTDKELASPDKLDSLSTAWGKLYRTSIIKKHRLTFVSTKEIGTEDLLFNVYYFTWLKEAVYLPQPFYHYRKNNITSLTKLHKPRLSEQWEKLFSYIADWIRPLQRKDLELALHHRRALSLLGQGLNITFCPDGTVTQYRALKKLLYSETYKESIRQLPMKHFPLHWKCFYLAARHQCVMGVWILLRIINILINR